MIKTLKVLWLCFNGRFAELLSYYKKESSYGVAMEEKRSVIVGDALVLLFDKPRETARQPEAEASLTPEKEAAQTGCVHRFRCQMCLRCCDCGQRRDD